MQRLKSKILFLLIRMMIPAVLKAVFGLLPRRKNTLLLVKNEGIGDYILFRNYLETLKNSDKFKIYDIYLLGNTAFSQLAVDLDAGMLKGFYGYNDSFFLKWDWVVLLFKLQRLRPQTVIYASYSRKYAVDQLIKMINASRRVAIDGDTLNQQGELKCKSDRFYDELIQLDNLPVHEVERNQQIVEAITGQKCELQAPCINTTPLNKSANYKIVVFPGGSEDAKRWPAEKFSMLCKQLSTKLNKHIILAGSKADAADATLIKENLDPGHYTDTTGTLTLTDLCGLIAGAELLISNDTVAVHIAAATRTPVICVAKGDLYGRFVPYPQHISDSVFTVFPPGLNDTTAGYYQWSSLNISDVAVESVFSLAENILAETNTRLN